MQRGIKIVVVVVLFALLASIRFFQETLFYDPLTSFFKDAHSAEALPELAIWKMMGSTFFRYFLNSIISLLIIWVLFKNKEVLKISAILLLGLLIVLIIPYFFLLQSEAIGNHLPLFYVRRFLIQPLLLLVLLPAFYFQMKK